MPRTRIPALTASLLLGTALAGCRTGDSRLERLSTGIGRDSVIVLFDGKQPARSDPYIVGGHHVEAMYFLPADVDSTVPDRAMSPVVLVDGKVVGWGWPLWDSVATANRIVVQPK